MSLEDAYTAVVLLALFGLIWGGVCIVIDVVVKWFKKVMTPYRLRRSFAY